MGKHDAAQPDPSRDGHKPGQPLPAVLVVNEEAPTILVVPSFRPGDVLDNPLSSVEFRARRARAAASDASSLVARPLALRAMTPAPDREVPEYIYDPQRQIATDAGGQPLGPGLKKDWTTVEGTHTDGDGGDNELWDWEEIP